MFPTDEALLTSVPHGHRYLIVLSSVIKVHFVCLATIVILPFNVSMSIFLDKIVALGLGKRCFRSLKTHPEALKCLSPTSEWLKRWESVRLSACLRMDHGEERERERDCIWLVSPAEGQFNAGLFT